MITQLRQPAITATGLRKSYGEKIVLDGIDLSVAEGTVFALLGPNGAGKTTTVQILSTLLSADGGDAQVGGHDLARDPNLVRAVIGVTGPSTACSPARRTCRSWRTCATSANPRVASTSPNYSSNSIWSTRRGNHWALTPAGCDGDSIWR